MLNEIYSKRIKGNKSQPLSKHQVHLQKIHIIIKLVFQDDKTITKPLLCQNVSVNIANENHEVTDKYVIILSEGVDNTM